MTRKIGASERSQKIVILGWYGHGNLGDEMILECMLAGLRAAARSPSFVIISRNPRETERLHGVRSVMRGRGARQVVRRFWSILNADLFILGGGGLLNSYGSSDLSVLSWLGPLRLANRLGVPTMTYGIGVAGPWTQGAKEAVGRILGRTSAVCVRDRESAESLKGMGVTQAQVTADPAILLPQLHSFVPPPAPHGRGPMVSVFVRHWYVSENRVPDLEAWGVFKRELAESLGSLISKLGASVRFVPMRATDPIDDDRAVAEEVSELIPNRGSVELLGEVPTSSEMLSLVGESDLVIGMRLHSLIVAASLGVPMIGVNYHPKVGSFMGSASAGDWVYEIGRSPRGWLRESAEKALDGGFPRDRVLGAAAALGPLASLNVKAAVGLLSPAPARLRGLRRVLSALGLAAPHTPASPRGLGASEPSSERG